MKLTERHSGLFLEEIKREDIRFANLGGRLTGSKYDDPNRPKHEYVVWIDDPVILDKFREMNVTISERVSVDEDTGKDTSRFSVRFKAYPKMAVNRLTGKEEQRPKVLLKTGDNAVRLLKESFGLVDSAYVKEVYIRFHLYQYDDRKPDCIAAIDELWCVVDEKAGFVDDSYLEEKLGYYEEDSAPGEGEEVPFA